MNDYYELLEVHPRASQEVIARAFRVLVSRYHPDVHPPERRAWAEDMMKRVNEAFAVLSDPQKRVAFDAERDRATAQSVSSATSQGSATTKSTAPTFAVVDVAMCAFHPSRPRISTCLECHKSICEECRQLSRDGRPYCRECAVEVLELANNGNTMANTRAIAWRASHAQNGPLRLSAIEWVNVVLTTAALTAWVYGLTAPSIVNASKVTVVVVVSVAVAASFVFSITASIRFYRRISRAPKSSLLHLVSAIVACLVIWSGVLAASGGARKTNENIAEHETKAAQRADEVKVQGYLRAFITSFPGHAEPKKGFWERAKDGVWNFLKAKREDAERSTTQVSGEEVYPFSVEMPQEKVLVATSHAQKYLAATKGNVDEPRLLNRAVCLHFLVWAALNNRTNLDVWDAAVECVSMSLKTKAPNRDQQIVDCSYYLATRTNALADLGVKQKIAEVTRWRDRMKRAAPSDSRLAEVNGWLNDLQKQVSTAELKKQLVELTTNIRNGHAQAAQAGLLLITPEAGRQAPDETDRLSSAELNWNKSNLETLKQLKQNYDLARPGGPVAKPITDAIAPLEAEANRQAQERQAAKQKQDRQAALRQLLSGIRQDMQAKPPNATSIRERGLAILTGELAMELPEQFESFAHDLGAFMHAKKDQQGLQSLVDQYERIAPRGRHKTQFQTWLDSLQQQGNR